MVGLSTLKGRMLCLLLPAVLMIGLAPGAGRAELAQEPDSGSSDYAEKLVRGRAVQHALDVCVSDIEANDARLVAATRTLETELGPLRTQERHLEPQLVTAQVAAEQSAAALEQAQQEQADLRRQLARLTQERNAIQRAVKDCKDKAWIFGFVCDAAKELSGLRAKENKLNAQIKERELRLKIKRQEATDADTQLSVASSQWKELNAEISRISGQISQIEPQIERNKSVLAATRNSFQAARNTVTAFESTLAKAEAVDTEDDRRRTQVKINRLSGEIDGLLASTPKLLADGRAVLPPDHPGCAAF